MGYWPDGTNTGVPAGVILDARTGDIHVTKAGTVLSGLDIHGTVYIEADNVTIQNSRITSSSYWSIYIRQGITGATVQDSEIDGQGSTGKGILGQGTFLRNDIKGVVDGIDIMGDNSLIEGNYIHDLFGTDSPHYDGINIDASNVTVRHNTVINDHSQTSALMVSSDWGIDTNVLIEDNLLVGGGYTIYGVTGDAGPGSLVNVRFVNNHFGGGYYGLTRLNTTITMTGNLNDGVQLATGLDDDGPYQAPSPAPSGPTERADTLTGDNGNNVIDALGGNDRVDGLAGNDSLGGGAGNDTLIGGLGNDRVNGGAGADNMRAGAGSDVYVVDNASDIVNEALAGSNGTDLVQSSITFSLANTARALGAVENLTLLGSGNIRGIGNSLNNAITGNAGPNSMSGAGGADRLSGGAGNDMIYGGAGNDRLAGGAGNDHFVFNTTPNATTNVDTILDFNVAQDAIRFDNAVMPGLGSDIGALSSAAFWKSTTGLAHDSNDRIIYETDTGWLNYDSNGSAAGGAVHIATLTPNLALTAADFFVV